MKKRIFTIALSLAVIFTYSFSMPVFAGTAKLKTIKVLNGREYTGYDIKDGVKMTWKSIKGAEKYHVVKNGKRIKTYTAKKNKKTYTFTEKDPIFDNDNYSVCATKSAKQKQYYNKKTKKWQTKKPAKKYIKKTRYKKVQKVFATSTSMPIKLNSGSNGEGGSATNIEYYTDADSNIVGYKKFDIADTHYFDISDNEDTSVSKDYWKEFVSKKYMPNGNSLLKEWATIGESICSQYEGYRTYWGSWKNDYHGGGNRLNYIPDMSRTTEGTWGGKSRDNSKASGLLTANSFSEVRNKMSKQIQERIDHNALDKEKSKILSNSKLSVLDDDTPRDIVYTVGTNIDENFKYGNKYKYSSHAIIFYDFELEPVIDENLESVNELSRYKTLEEASKALDRVKFSDKDDLIYTDNKSIDPVSMTKTSGTSYSNSLSTTMTNSKEISYGQSLDISYGMDFNVIKDFLTTKFNVNVGFTWGQAYSSAKSDGETITESEEKQQSVTVTVPPQTSLAVREQTADVNCKYGFKTPMRVAYKVCIADLVGRVYADDAVTCNFESYDQGSYAVFFGEGGKNGVDATDSLYLRAEKNVNNKEFDDIYGKVYTCRNKTERDNEGITWANMSNAAKTSINELIYNQPMFSNGGTINITCKATKFTVDEPVPLYKLGSVCVDKSKKEYDQEINVSVGDNYAINNRVQLIGYNNNISTSAIYTKFVQGDGEWYACDENGDIIANSKNELFEITDKGILKAKKAGNGFVTYRLSTTQKNNYTSREGGRTVNPEDPHGNNDQVCSMPIITVSIK